MTVSNPQMKYKIETLMTLAPTGFLFLLVINKSSLLLTRSETITS